MALLTLAIDTSDRHYSVAVLEDGEVLLTTDSRIDPNRSTNSLTAEGLSALPAGSSPSVMLFPMLKKMLGDADLTLEQIDLIAVAKGPGMFTGLRIGIVAAKTLAYVHATPLVAVGTLEAIATRAAIWLRTELSHPLPAAPTSNLRSLRGANSIVIKPILNAQRQQIFGGCFQYDPVAPDWIQEVAPTAILGRQEWFDNLANGDVVTGTGLRPILEARQISPDGPDNPFTIVSESSWECTAAVVGQVAVDRFGKGQRDDLWTLEPHYFRPSYAEEVQ